MQKNRLQQRNSVREDAMANELDYEDEWPARMPSSARRYQDIVDVRTDTGRAHSDAQLTSQRNRRSGYNERDHAIPPRRTATQTNIPVVPTDRRRTGPNREISQRERELETDILPVSPRRFRPHWLFFVGLSMLVMVVGWVAFSAVANWWQITQDDLHYGRPRTFQTDAVVGHNDSATNPSHYIAINLNRHIEIIEFPGGDPTKARIYIGPTLIGDGQDLAAVTLTFKDVNGDGLPDMVVNVQNSHFVFINDNGTFRPARPGENIHL